jgi:hypothetical protein
MAYRFILEVPETLVEDANVVIYSVGDAQAHFVRDSHGLGFEDPYKDFTVAAHSLRIIDAIYAWYEQMGATTPESRVNVRVVLHSGERLSVHEVPKAQMIAAIRRDQPWVERSIPKIGEHDTRTTGGTEIIESDVVPDTRDDSNTAVSTLERPEVATWVNPVTILATDEVTVVVRVYDLSRPQRIYGEFFGLAVIGRGNREPDGSWEFLPAEYDSEQSAQWGTQPEYAFLQNGPLSIALERQGRGLPLDIYSELLKPINITVDMKSLRHIRSMVLMRSYNVLDDTQRNGIVFRDPFAYTWAVFGHEEG